MRNLWVTIFLFTVSAVYAADNTDSRKFPDDRNQSFLLGLGGNYPIVDSANEFGPSIYHPIVGVRHLTENWVLGLSMHFKFFNEKADNSRLAIWALEEETSYRIRLYHPFYMLTGIKFLYLYPVQGGVYPLRRSSDYNPEVGIAATVSFLYFLSQQTALGVYTDLWRGTASRTLEGIETGVHFMFPTTF